MLLLLLSMMIMVRDDVCVCAPDIMSFLQPTTQFPFHNSIRASIIHRPCSLVYPLFMYTSIPEPLPSFPTSPSIIPSYHEKKEKIIHTSTDRAVGPQAAHTPPHRPADSDRPS